MAIEAITRRRSFGLVAAFSTALVFGSLPTMRAGAEGDDDAALEKRFESLSQNGNVECSAKFEASIGTMAPGARLQGSCCAPMDRARYLEQIKGIRKYANFSEVPTDPYDIPADLARKLMSYYQLPLNPQEQAAYDYAMAHSDIEGPCCCKCWRWEVYGGLGKQLIRERQFTGQQLVDLWNIASGCGGPIGTKMH